MSADPDEGRAGLKVSQSLPIVYMLNTQKSPKTYKMYITISIQPIKS